MGGEGKGEEDAEGRRGKSKGRGEGRRGGRRGEEKYKERCGVEGMYLVLQCTVLVCHTWSSSTSMMVGGVDTV